MEKNFIESKINKDKQIKLPNTTTTRDEFHTQEIEDIINNSKNTAPGLNRISYKLLKLLPINHIEKLTDHLNKAWEKQQYPKIWKEIKLIIIPKPNKKVDEIGNYRGIHLYSVISKITSKLIKQRLNKITNSLNTLPETTYGFRKGKSTTDLLNHLLNIIEKNKEKNIIL